MLGKSFSGGVRHFSSFPGPTVVVLCSLPCIKHFNPANDGTLDTLMVS